MIKYDGLQSLAKQKLSKGKAAGCIAVYFRVKGQRNQVTTLQCGKEGQRRRPNFINS